MYFSIVTFFDQSSFSGSGFSLARGAQSSCQRFDLSLDQFECIICVWQTKLASLLHSAEPQVTYYS